MPVYLIAGIGNANTVYHEAFFLPVPKFVFGTRVSKFFSMSNNTNRVFWTGGKGVMKAAAEYATANGATKLKMTGMGKALMWTGRKLTLLTNREISYKVTKPLWEYASKNFAKGARCDARLFIDFRLARPDATWFRIESPILVDKQIPITIKPL